MCTRGSFSVTVYVLKEGNSNMLKIIHQFSLSVFIFAQTLTVKFKINFKQNFRVYRCQTSQIIIVFQRCFVVIAPQGNEQIIFTLWTMPPSPLFLIFKKTIYILKSNMFFAVSAIRALYPEIYSVRFQ